MELIPLLPVKITIMLLLHLNIMHISKVDFAFYVKEIKSVGTSGWQQPQWVA